VLSGFALLGRFFFLSFLFFFLTPLGIVDLIFFVSRSAGDIYFFLLGIDSAGDD